MTEAHNYRVMFEGRSLSLSWACSKNLVKHKEVLDRVEIGGCTLQQAFDYLLARVPPKREYTKWETPAPFDINLYIPNVVEGNVQRFEVSPNKIPLRPYKKYGEG